MNNNHKPTANPHTPRPFTTKQKVLILGDYFISSSLDFFTYYSKHITKRIDSYINKCFDTDIPKTRGNVTHRIGGALSDDEYKKLITRANKFIKKHYKNNLG